MQRPRMTILQWMIGIAAISVLLGIVVAVRREIEREFPSTPSGWAWREAAAYDRWPDSPSLAIQNPEIAIAFERNKVRYHELAIAF